MKSAHHLIAVSLSMLLLLIPYSLGVSISSDEVFLGSTINITLDPDSTLDIQTPQGSISYLGSQSLVQFTAQVTGQHTVVEHKTQSSENVSFMVHLPLKQESPSTQVLLQEVYDLGTVVYFNLERHSEKLSRIRIHSPHSTYELLDINGTTGSFLPQEAGKYTLEVILTDDSSTSYGFSVEEQLVVPRLRIEDSLYGLGDLVIIYFDSFDNTPYDIEVRTPQTTYRFFRTDQESLAYTPQELGAHTVILSEQNQELHRVTFEVSDETIDSVPTQSEPVNESNTSISPTRPFDTLESFFDRIDKRVSQVQRIVAPPGARIANLTNHIHIVDSKGNRLRNLTIHTKTKQGFFTGVREQEQHNVTIDLPFKRIRSMKVNRMTLPSPGQQLGIETLNNSILQETFSSVGPIAQSFAVDPASFAFDVATLEVQAQGTSLYKCALWNYTEQRCFGSWQRMQSLTPGQWYNITLTPTDPGFVESVDEKREVVQAYQSAASVGQTVSTVTALTLDNQTHVSSIFSHSNTVNPERINIDKSDTYRISYGCSFLQSQGTSNADRNINGAQVRINGTVLIHPSLQACYTRTANTDGNTCGISGTLLYNLSEGSYLELMGGRQQGDNTILTDNDCYLYADRVAYPAAMHFDSTGGQDYDGTIITVNMDESPYYDPSVFSMGTDRITVLEDGWYKVHYHVCMEDTGQGNRQTVLSWLRINGTTNVTPSFAYSYVRHATEADKNCNQGHLLRYYVAGEYTEMRMTKFIQESGGTSIVRQNQSWLTMWQLTEDNDNYFMAYESGSSQVVSDGGSAAITFDSEIIDGEDFSFTTAQSQIDIDDTGVYELSYQYSYIDGANGGRAITCGFFRINGDETLRPSENCAYSRGDPQAQIETINANVIANLTSSDSVELVVGATGSGITILPDASWVTIVPLATLFRPNITALNHPLNNTRVNTTVDFNFTVVDIDSAISSCTLYINSSGVFAPNNVSTDIVNASVNNITIDLEDGVYFWNIECVDVDGPTDTFGHNFTVFVDAVPNITGTVQNDGPVSSGEQITFNATCTNPGDQFRLIVCNSSVSVCNADTPTEDIVCEGPLNTSTEATCKFSPGPDLGGSHAGDIATCCDVQDQCDPLAVSVDTWEVRAPPSIIVTPTDYGSDVTSPTQAGADVIFNVTASDPNGDDYYILVCPTNETNPGQGDCEFGETRYCFSQSTPSTSGEHSSCSYTTVPDVDSGNLSWHVFACDDESAPNILCSPADNGTGVTGSPFYVNNPPDVSAVLRNMSFAKVFDTINVSTVGASDQENNAIKLQCGQSSGVYDLCDGDVNQPQVTCAFSSPFTDDTTHTIFCVVNDTLSISIESSFTYTADNTAPNASLPAINDTDFIVQLLDVIQINITSRDLGSGLINVTVGNNTEREMHEYGANDIYQVNATPQSLGCTAQDGPCVLQFRSTDNVSLINDSETVTLTIDNVPPQVTLPEVNDSDRIVQSTDTLEFNVTVSDTNTITSVQLQNETTLSMSQLGAKWQIVTTPVALGCTAEDGTCNLTFVATDVAGNVNASVQYGIRIDNRNPSVVGVEFNDSDRVVRSDQVFLLNVSVLDSNAVVNVTVRNESSVQMFQFPLSNKWTVNVTGDELGCTAQDGQCNLTFIATDVAGNVNNTVTTSVTIDNRNPSVVGVEFNDSDRVVRSDQVFLLNVSVLDSNAVVNVTVRNESSVQMFQFPLSNKWTVNVTGDELGCTAVDGLCNLTFEAVDAAGNINDTVHTSIRIDNLNPNVFNPEINDTDRIVTSTQSLLINITVTDTNTVINVTAENISIAQMSQFPSSNKWTVNTSAQALGCPASGVCNITFTGIDAVNNQNRTTILGIRIDNGPPQVTNQQINDTDNLVESTNTVNISVLATDGTGVVTVVVNGTSLSQIGGTDFWQLVTTLDTFGCNEPTCTLGFNATDSLGNYNDSETLTMGIDNLFPQLTLEVPSNGFETTLTAFDINFTVTDTVDSVLTCNLTIDGTVYNNEEIDATSGAETNISVSGQTEGNHTWNVTCRDDIPHYNFSNTQNFIIDLTAPVINLSTPLNNTLETASNLITFVYNVSDVLTDIAECELIIDGTSVTSESTIVEDSPAQFDYVLSNGDYDWSVNCTDAVGNEGSSVTFNISVVVVGDTIGPLISLHTPPEDTYTNQTTLDFNYTPSDVSGILNCTLRLDGVDNASCGSYANESFLLGWKGRQEINITETSGSELTEYQVLYTVDTASLITGGELNADCSDLRFTNKSNDPISFYIDNSSSIGCNSDQTHVWLQLDTIQPSEEKTTYMYYNNPSASSISNKYEVFNYSTPQPVYYIVHDLLDTPGDLNLVSFRDGNDIQVGSSTALLNESNTTQFADTTYSQNSAVSVTQPIMGAGSGGGQDAIVPLSFASTTFINAVGRGAQTWHIYAPYADATVGVFDGNGGTGFTLVSTTFTVSQGTASSTAREISGTGTGTTAADNSAVWINSSEPILVFHDNTASQDAMTMGPDADNQWCFVTRYHVGILQDATLCDILESDGTNTSATYNEGDEIFLDYGGTTRGEQGLGVHILCNASVGTHVFADEDGSESATCLPEKELDNEYYLPSNGEYVGITSPHAGTNCRLVAPNGVDRFTGTTTTTVDYPFPSRLNFGADNSVNVFAGDRLICDHAVYAYLESTAGDTTGDEQNLWNVKQARKRASSEPTVSYGDNRASTQGDPEAVCQIQNNEINNFTVQGFNDGLYLWNITCIDSSSNLNNGTSVTYNVTVDTTIPGVITLVSVENDTISSDLTPTLTWTQTVEVNFANYTLEFSDQVDFSTSNATISQFDITSTSDTVSLDENSVYYWRVRVFDLAGNSFTSEFFRYTTDNTIPVVTLQSPTPNTWNSSSSLIFRYVATDDHLKNCSLFANFSGTFDQLQDNITVSSGVVDEFDPVIVDDGIYVWNVQCQDNASNRDFATNNFSIFVDQTPPNITLDEPIDLFNTTNTFVNFRYTASDNLATALNCNLSINDVVNETNIATVRDVQETVTVSGFNDGNYTWNVTCTDLAGNVNSSIYSRFTVDNTGPVVELENPPNATVRITDGVEIFSYNVTDEFSSIANCSLYINGAFNQSDQTIQEATTQTFSTYLTSGFYNWSVTCVDNLLTSGTSVNFTIIIEPPKFIVPINPANGTIVDRDKVSLTTDNITLQVELSDGAAGETVFFYANLTDPFVEDQTDILLGSSTSDISGIAELNYSGLNSLGSKMFAGSYEWYVESGVYIQNYTATFAVYGGLNLSFRFANELPSLLYGPDQNASIQMFLKSFGPESDGQINGTYLAFVNATLLAFNGTNETIPLFDPPVWDYGPPPPPEEPLEWGYAQVSEPLGQNAQQLVNVESTKQHRRVPKELSPFIRDSKENRIDAQLQFINNQTNLSYETPGVFKRALQAVGIMSRPILNQTLYDVTLTPEELPIKKIDFRNMSFNGSFELGLEELDQALINTNETVVQSYAIDPEQLDFEEAFVTVTAKGSALHKCEDWNFTSQTCQGTWKKIMTTIPGQNYTVRITPDDPGFAETNLTILTVQSYPVVGGKWDVRFTTEGKANLTIRAINGTSMTFAGTNADLRFEFIKCGDTALNFTIVDGAAHVEDYECAEESSEQVTVLTRGKHYLEFTFGDQKGYAQNLASQDFYVQRGTTTTSASTVTITNGSQYNLYPGATVENTFIRLTNTRRTGMGDTAGGGTQNLLDFTFRIDNPENILTSVTFTRAGVTNPQRVDWEVIQYIGPQGGDNEIIVRDTAEISTTGLNAQGSTITDIEDVNKVAVFVTSQSTDNAGANLWQNALFTSNISESGVNHVPEFRRGDSTSTGFVSYAAIEFVGDNWRDVQRVEFTSADHGATAWATGTFNNSGTFAIPTALLNSSKAFLENLYRIESGATQGLDDSGENIELTADSNTQFTTRRRTTANDALKTHVVWVIEHLQQGVGAMRVQHHARYDGDNTGTPEERVYDANFTAVAQLNATSIMGEAASSDGGGNAYPRGSANVRLVSSTRATWTVSDAGQEERRTFSVVEWPTVPRSVPNVTLISPINNTINNSLQINFSFVATTELNFTRCALYTDEGGWSEKESNLSVVLNNTVHVINTSFSNDGTYQWNIFCENTFDLGAFATHNRTIIIDVPPDISGTVANDGPVDADAPITFTGSCTNLNDNFHLIVCNSTVSTCNLATPANEIICNGTLGTDTTPSCTFSPNSTFAGDHTGDVATCCDDAGQCDSETVSVNSWTVRGPPLVTAGPSDFNSTVLNPNAAGTFVNFTVKADDPNDDASYKMLVCNVSTTPSGPATCDGGTVNELCSAFANENEDAACGFSDTHFLSGNYSWHVFVCDSALCSPAFNGTGVNGSPFYINSNASMLNVTSSTYLAAFGDSITLTSVDAADNEGNEMRLQCGNESIGPFDTVCSGAYGVGERSCTFSFPYSDNTPHTFYCVLNDTFSISPTNTTQIVADNSNPVITLNQPANDTFATVNSLQFNYTPLDSQLVLCSLYGNFTSPSFIINQTDTSAISGIKNSFNITALLDGRYLWNVFCQDSVSNEAFAPDNFTVIVDTIAPTVNLISPSDGASQELSNTVDFTFETTDIGTNVTTCSLIVNGTVNGSIFGPVEGDPNQIIQSFLPDGSYNWSINCSDETGLVGIAPEFRNVTVAVANTPPTLELTFPLDGGYVNGVDFELIYTPFDDKGISNCTLFLNGVENSTDHSITQNQVNNFTINSTQEQEYNWSVTCEDNIGQQVSTTTAQFFVDRTNPVVTLISPPNGSNFNESDRVPFRYNVTDNYGADMANCSLVLNDLETGDIQTGVGVNVTQTLLVTLSNQQLYWNILCADQAGNTDVGDNNFNLTVNASLKIWNNTFYLSDNFEGIWKVNANAVANYFFPTVNVNNRNLTLDLSPPNITLIAPANNSNSTEQVVDIIYNVTDVLSNVTACTLYVDNISVAVNNTLNPIENNFTHNFSFGTHFWNIECVDYVGNRVNSSQFIINIRFRDLFINSSYIFFSNDNPVANERIEINATLFNLGTQEVEDNFFVDFFDVTPYTSTLIDSLLVQGINESSNLTLNVSWTASRGNHTILVRVDSTDVISESNETNNNATRSLFISSYQTFFGNISGNLLLANNENTSVIDWATDDNLVAYVYVIDADSQIDFASMYGLGRNLSYNITVDDFAYADLGLNLTNFSDALNRTYVQDVQIKDTINVSLYEQGLQFIPVVNSTNSSAFRTGILWDTSDPNNGTYNGTQDLIFFTQTNLNSLGQYGVSDYEISVPATLKEYVEPNLIDELVFYVELT